VGVSTMVLILNPLFRWFSFLIRSNFAFSKKAEDGFGRNEGFQKKKVMVLETTMQKTPTLTVTLNVQFDQALQQ
jgi:hypothetical protein